ncbi:sulfotransferase family protein [Thiobacter aerophilum]|uniref:Sulfotransferase n=1 Tax=Thiobacter aerophilum TaxID=3121275 RepID=A0ABV0EDG5_9BURK
MSEFWVKVDKTLRHHAQAGRRVLRGVIWDLLRPAASRPVIILGCSRAGTTLVYKTFSESLELGSLQRETHDFWMALHHPRARNWDTHALDARHASPADRDYVTRYFYAWTGRSRWVDKNNQNGLCVPYLHALFPDAHFVYVKRSPGDNVNSLIEGWGKPEEFATWSAELPEQVAIDGGRYTRWCFFLAEGWRAYSRASIEEVCAFQYVAINQAILEARALLSPNQWSEVFYEDLVRDPVNEFRRLFSEAELSFTPALEKHCARVLDTPYNAFSAIRLDKWKDGCNRARIERILPMVEPVARRMGYEP